MRVADEAAMLALGAKLLPKWKAGDVILLYGDLGAGKTTFVRGVLHALGYEGEVRSPTFNLMQVFATTPPVLHADLYRVKESASLGLEDFLPDHLSIIEWPERFRSRPLEACWKMRFEFDGDARTVTLEEPSR
ncbi:MAG: tRNA (adenosine(37)-N6)-threonylcarbamoyltransferase complex ATPase subunit type 1 TsaE [Armatimonadetes bacterium]|nr:tRNA (adenosine(37)-N6)-threonylcarbamoyltransferase complex ATPase subunit type 1 TsaE [Armatimonadota bacterium]